jgi:DNA-binding NtrC family response regulator
MRTILEHTALALQRPKSKRVVVAEDDAEMRDLVISELRRDGWTVIEARNGADLRFALRHGEPVDLVVSDIRMPAFSGLELVEQLRRQGNRTPVILMTGFGDEAVREAVEHLDALLFDKPFELDDLRTAVLHLLRHRRP